MLNFRSSVSIDTWHVGINVACPRSDLNFITMMHFSDIYQKMVDSHNKIKYWRLVCKIVKLLWRASKILVLEKKARKKSWNDQLYWAEVVRRECVGWVLCDCCIFFIRWCCDTTQVPLSPTHSRLATVIKVIIGLHCYFSFYNSHHHDLLFSNGNWSILKYGTLPKNRQHDLLKGVLLVSVINFNMIQYVSIGKPRTKEVH